MTKKNNKKEVNKSVLDDVNVQSLQKNTKTKVKISWDNGAAGNILLGRFLDQINTFHSTDHDSDKELESILLKQQQHEYEQIDKELEGQDPSIPRYSPSSVSKCMRELYFKYSGEPFEKDKVTIYPYQKRWQKNAQYVHKRIQDDILYSSKHVQDAFFKPYMLPNGLPAWESAVKRYKIIEHNGEQFALFGMCDGILETKDNQLILFEFKTKSTTVAAIGDYKLKEPQESHYTQIQAYFILYENLDGCILLYETLAKDGWMKNQESKPDLKGFYVTSNSSSRSEILDKLANLTHRIRTKQIPPRESDKCLFCPFKTVCDEVGE